MMSRLVLLVLLLVVALPLVQATGEWKQVDGEEMLQLLQEPEFMKAEKLARESYLRENNGELGQLIQIEQQIVAGINYRMTFNQLSGDKQITVFAQPWTDTYQVIDVSPENEEI